MSHSSISGEESRLVNLSNSTVKVGVDTSVKYYTVLLRYIRTCMSHMDTPVQYVLAITMLLS